MNWKFSATIPSEITTKPILISGEESQEWNYSTYLIHGNRLQVFEIKFEYYCGSFQEALIVGNLVAVGYQNYFYLFNFLKNENILSLAIDGYFGHLYFYDDIFYIAGALGIYAVDRNGKVVWANNNIAVDGVIINQFTQNNILGIGEQDPPGGWKNFILDRRNGALHK